MTIQFRCEHCGHAIEAPDTSGGQRSFCPKCGNAITIPLLTDPPSESSVPEPSPADVGATEYRPPGGNASESPFDGTRTSGGASLDPYQTPRTDPTARFSTPSTGNSNSLAVVALVMAISAFVFGWWCCCGLYIPLSIAALVLGIIGLQNSKTTGSGRGAAIAAIGIAVLALVLSAVLLLFGFAVQLQEVDAVMPP